jgi:DNA-binding transcriptional LysR family regulator
MDGSTMGDWSAIRTFLVVVEAGSFSAAARRLGLSQSTVSRQVCALEAVVGRRLFVRAGRTVTLTDAGATLATPASDVRDAIARFERLAAGARRTASGLVRLATVDEVARRVLAPAFPALRARHPELSLEMVARVETANLERRDADLALRFSIPESGDLVRKRAMLIRYGVFGTPAVLGEASPSWVGFERALAGIPEERWLAENVAPRRVVLRATSIDAQLEACAAGAGLALLPVDTASAHPLLRRRADGIELTRPLWLVAHRDVLSSPRVRAVFRWALEACATT